MRSLVRPYFEALLLLLLAAGFCSLVSTGRVELPVVFCGATAFIVRALLLWRGKRPSIPPHWVTLATLLYFFFYLVDVYVISNSFIEATVHLVLFVAIVKLFSASQARDYLYLCVLAFLEMLASATLTVGTSFLVAFLLFLVLTVATFVSFEVFRAEGSATVIARGDADDFPNQLRTSLFGISLAIAVSVFVAGALIFFLLPRMSMNYWNPNYRESRLTGFSDEVRLGEVGDLQQTNATVMHIRVLDAHPVDTANVVPSLRWRGRALSDFDGKTWSNPFRPYVVPTAVGRLQFPLEMAPQSVPRRFLHYRITLEPIGSDVLFFAPRLDSVWTRYSDLGVDATLTISSIGRGFSGTSYNASSDVSQPTDKDLAAAPDRYPSGITDQYLQLPDNLDPRIPELARKIAGNQPTPIARMRTLESYLRRNYRYSLKDLPRGPDPLADFLFHRRAGHCEYFASALAIMGRSLGVPTRVVNGFITGQYNDISGAYVVRGRDAHSWVEAYFPFSRTAAPLTARSRGTKRLSAESDSGSRLRRALSVRPRAGTRTWMLSDPETYSGTWITFDATAGSPDAVAEGWSRMMLYIDALQSFWQEWIINYDFFHQVSLAQRIQGRVLDHADTMRHFLVDAPARMRHSVNHTWRVIVQDLKSPRVQLLILLPFALLVALLWVRQHGLSALMLRFPALLRRSSHPDLWRAREAARYYRRLQRTLDRAGYSREPAQTAEDLLQEVDRDALRPALGQFIAHYQLARFGRDAGCVTLLSADLKQVRRALRAA
jgi:transglutaminase-like putative cysteine protease